MTQNLDILFTQLDFLNPRKQAIKQPNKILNEYSHINHLYLKIICHYSHIEINADVVIYDYENALSENHHIKHHYPHISEKYWLFAYSGQGDDWFFNKENNNIVFYNHDNGEYEHTHFSHLNIDFDTFLKFSLLCRALENQEYSINDEYKQQFIKQANEIKMNLLDIYPFNLW